MPAKKLHPVDERVRQLLTWARAERIMLTRLELGDVVLELTDTHLGGRLAEPRAAQSDGEAAKSLFAKFGGALLVKAEGEQSEVEKNMMEEEDGV